MGWFQAIRYQVKVYDWKDVYNVGKFFVNTAKNYVNTAVNTVKNTANSVINTATKTVNSFVSNAESSISNAVKTISNAYNSFTSNKLNNYTLHMAANVIGGYMLSAAIYTGPATFGLSTAVLLAAGGLLTLYGSGMLEDPYNPANQASFATSVALSFAAPFACAKLLKFGGGTDKFITYSDDLIGSTAKSIVKGSKEFISNTISGPGVDITIKGIYH
ncbi:MAG: hypothetical protein ACRC1M_07510 [Methanobacteriaceae archaeon]